jgi:hypothetical protein
MHYCDDLIRRGGDATRMLAQRWSLCLRWSLTQIVGLASLWERRRGNKKFLSLRIEEEKKFVLLIGPASEPAH